MAKRKKAPRSRVTRRRGRPPKIQKRHYVLVAAAVELWRRREWPLRRKKHPDRPSASDLVSTGLNGLIGSDMVEKVYKAHRLRIRAKDNASLMRLSAYLHRCYGVQEIIYDFSHDGSSFDTTTPRGRELENATNTMLRLSRLGRARR